VAIEGRLIQVLSTPTLLGNERTTVRIYTPSIGNADIFLGGPNVDANLNGYLWRVGDNFPGGQLEITLGRGEFLYAVAPQGLNVWVLSKDA
jgi:hypothetical protein